MTSGFSTPFPHYQIEVEYQPENKRIKGTASISFSANHYPSDHLLFALPMNRFLDSDTRGPRKILQTPIFSLDEFKKIEDDPLFPNGFDHGQTIIHSVTDREGKPISYQIVENQDIVVGFSTQNGLLSVQLDHPLSQSSLVIHFETILPARFLDGLVETELTAIEWHPQLLQFANNAWNTDLMTPSPGTYEVTWKSKQEGTLITTTGAHQTKSNQAVVLSHSQRPLKYFPLVFSPEYHEVSSNEFASVHSYFLEDDKRRATLLARWGEEFINFASTEYDLSLPWKQIFVIEIRGNHEQIQVFNNLVLVTTPHYKRTEFLDRRVVGFFSRGLGELWFGETVWHNLDSQFWLSRGLGAFLSLKFYASKYGPDAGIFDFIDWLNPRYREHFNESMAQNIKTELQQPIISSIQKSSTKHSETRILLRTSTYKAALVVSMLEYLVGKDVFRNGFKHFFNEYQYELATENDLRQSMELYYGKRLDWFFQQWFHTTKELDYALGPVIEESLPDGQNKIEISIRQISSGVMPVDVKLTTQDGSIFLKRTSGFQKEEKLTFFTESQFSEVSLDPDENLLELSRTNNHSETYLRIRPAFDWKKRREVMSLLIPRVGSNAIDGNQVGIESNNSLPQNYSLLATMGYGTKNKQFLYIFKISKNQFILSNVSWTLEFSQLGGVISRGISLNYNSPSHKERLSYTGTIELDQETVYKTSEDKKEKNDEEAPEESGDTSNFALVHTGQIGFKNLYFPSWSIRVEQPLIELGADFTYTLMQSRLMHLLNVGHKQRIRWTWIYASTIGDSPLQKKHQLGSPQVLRGYPQRTILRDDQLLASRLDYEFPLVNNPWWGNISSLGIQGILFFDIGKVWKDNDHFEKSRQRQDVGMGFQWGIDTVALFQVPFKIELAYPFGDSEFKKPQFVLAGALSFF
ncbi:MAG: BamA/TamA family outer membrane protein [SAR324 cluster bacterium]|nr:BamA/TamA family outer membrane protein [SAR324 cluster bacterium]